MGDNRDNDAYEEELLDYEEEDEKAPDVAAKADGEAGKKLVSIDHHFRNLSILSDMSPAKATLHDSERYSYNPSQSWNPEVEEYFEKAYGADHFARICKALTLPSSYSCVRVNIIKTSSDAVIQKLAEMLLRPALGYSDDDLDAIKLGRGHEFGIARLPRGFIQTYCSDTGTIKEYPDNLDGNNQVKLRNDTSAVVKCPIPGLEDYVVFVQGTGPHDINYHSSTPNQPLKEVIVSRKCAESVLRGAQIYVPGVLACSAHVEKDDLVAVSVGIEQKEPDGKWATGITRGVVLQGLETDVHYFQRKGLYIWQGTTTMSRAGIFRVLEGVAVNMTRRVFDLPSFNNVLKGDIFLQNLPSIITAHILDPQKGERILDMCAAPGGKTSSIAMLMKNEGEVVAVDRSHNKVKEIENLAEELGLKCITTYKLDALKSVYTGDELSEARNSSTSTSSSKSKVDHKISLTGTLSDGALPSEEVSSETFIPEGGCRFAAKAGTTQMRNNQEKKNGPGKNHTGGIRVEKSKGFPPGSFDRVLLDAPCSALGLRPRLFSGEETMQSLRNHGKYQRRMLDQAVQLVRPGGVLVYSTCTLNPGENEALVRYALDTYKFLSLASQNPKVGGPGLVGFHTFADGYVEKWLRDDEKDLVQRFDPSLVDTIGFFIAKFNVGPKEA